MSHHRTALALSLALLALPATAHASACNPTITAYPGPPGSTGSNVEALGPGGLVGGESDVGAVVWRNGHAIDLGIPQGFVADFDSSGDMLINASDAGPPYRAYVIINGTTRQLHGLGGDFIWVRHMNDRRDIAGEATDINGVDHATVWRGASLTPTVLRTPAGYTRSDAVGINERGDIAGDAWNDDDSPQVGVVWHPDGRVEVLPAAPFAGDRGYGRVHVIDDLGVVAGDSGPNDINGRTATIWAGPLQHRVGQFLDGESSEFFGAAPAVYVGDGTYSGTFQDGAIGHAAISVAGLGPLRTLMPLSGDPRDPSNLHDAKLENGDVTVAGDSQTADGRQEGTVWTCALRQSFVPGRNLLH